MAVASPADRRTMDPVFAGAGSIGSRVREVKPMFTLRNIFAVGLFLFGTTFLWMTASFTGKTPPPSGPAWSVEMVLATVAVVGFSVAAWGVFKDQPWWELVAVISAAVGLLAVVPYMIGLSEIGGVTDSGVEINLGMHVIGSALVIALVYVPSAHEWLTRSLSRQ